MRFKKSNLGSQMGNRVFFSMTGLKLDKKRTQANFTVFIYGYLTQEKFK
jgi:hypothetical protein